MRSGLLIMTAGRASWGGLLVIASGRVFSTVTGRPATPGERWVLRVLGLRHLAQATVSAARPTPAVLGFGVAADLLHAATCAGAIGFLPRWRRAGLVDGVAATGFALTGRFLISNARKSNAR
jgi:hypothetical protein